MNYEVGRFLSPDVGGHYLLPPSFMATCANCRVETWHHVYAVDDEGVQKELTVCSLCHYIKRVARV